jgi:hypothetical protein
MKLMSTDEARAHAEKILSMFDNVKNDWWR